MKGVLRLGKKQSNQQNVANNQGARNGNEMLGQQNVANNQQNQVNNGKLQPTRFNSLNGVPLGYPSQQSGYQSPGTPYSMNSRPNQNSNSKQNFANENPNQFYPNNVRNNQPYASSYSSGNQKLGQGSTNYPDVAYQNQRSNSQSQYGANFGSGNQMRGQRHMNSPDKTQNQREMGYQNQDSNPKTKYSDGIRNKNSMGDGQKPHEWKVGYPENDGNNVIE